MLGNVLLRGRKLGVIEMWFYGGHVREPRVEHDSKEKILKKKKKLKCH